MNHHAIFAEFLARLSQCATRSERGDVVAHYARLCEVSPASLRRRAAKAGFDFGYRRRADRGTARNETWAAEAEAVATLIVQAAGDMPTWVAIDRCKKTGAIRADSQLPTYYVDRFMRTHAIARRADKQPASTRRCKWGDVGQHLQIDSTNCAQWFLPRDDGSIAYVGAPTLYRNKPPDKSTPPIIRYVAVEPVSGLFRVRYYAEGGERADLFLTYLHWVMSRASDPERMPMAGVPRTIVCDRGPGNLSAAVANACAALGIEVRPHLPGHPWAKGSVESLMHVWQRSFESELRLWPAGSLDDLNARAEAANAEFCSTRIHSRTHRTRAALYAEEVGEIVLPPPWPIYVEAATTAPARRRVRGGHLISYDGRDYYVGGLSGLATGDTVQVAKSVLDWDDETRPVRITHGERTIVERALIADERGNYADERVYTKRHDEELEAVAADRQARLDAPLPAAPPAVAVDKLPKHRVPTARLVIAPAAPVATYRRTPALLKLAEAVGRELSRFEVAGLGWQEAVTQQQIDTAAQVLRGEQPAAGGQTNAASAG